MSDAQHITLALKGRWFRHYGVCLCPAHANARSPALSLSQGSNGRLLAYCHAGCDFRAILDALRGLGLVEGQGQYSPPSAADLASLLAAENEQAAKQETRARNLLRDTLPIGGTIAETYLRSRGITCDLPDSLRFHPECWHPTGHRFPAMVALIEGAPRLAVHRTYLRSDGSGKAEIDPSRAMLGSCAGGAVRLSDAEGPLVVCEGIETGLSLLCGLLSGPATVWAALSTSGLRGLLLPPAAARLKVASDGDPAGQSAAHALATRADAAGWKVTLLPAPEGRDWNDVLTGKSAKVGAA